MDEELQSSILYWSIKRAVKVQCLPSLWCLTLPRPPQEELIKPKYKPVDLATAIPQIMDDKGLAIQLRNAVQRLHEQAQGKPRCRIQRKR